MWIQIRFSQSIHSVCGPESGFENPFMAWIHQRNRQTSNITNVNKQQWRHFRQHPPIQFASESTFQIHYETEARFGENEYRLNFYIRRWMTVSPWTLTEWPFQCHVDLIISFSQIPLFIQPETHRRTPAQPSCLMPPGFIGGESI